MYDNMDIEVVDEILLNSLSETMPDLGNIDIDKFDSKLPAKCETPTSSSAQSPASTPSKSSTTSSPHVVPNQQTLQHQGQQDQQLNNSHAENQQTSQQSQLILQQQQQQFLQQQNQQHQRQQNQHANVHQAQAHQQQQQMNTNMQRKVQLGPNFDRLGILNQGHEVPQQMAAPFFAKALQQHGSTTLGAILQAHQHAIQQQMQRENYIIQQFQHPMFQNMTFNNVYQQQQQQQQQQHQKHPQPQNPQQKPQRVNHPIMTERRSDDQIVPNPQILPSPDHWMQNRQHRQQQQQKQHHQKQQQIKQHQQQLQQLQQQQQLQQSQLQNSQQQQARKLTTNGGKNEEMKNQPETVTSTYGVNKQQKSQEKYFIFNSENANTEPSGEHETDQKSIMPPKNSVFVRYHADSNRRLPSFPEAFNNYVEKLKMKEQYVKSMLHQQQQQANLQFQAQYYRQMLAGHLPMEQIPFQFHQIPQGYPVFPQHIPHPNINLIRDRPPIDHEMMSERKKRKTTHIHSKAQHHQQQHMSQTDANKTTKEINNKNAVESSMSTTENGNNETQQNQPETKNKTIEDTQQNIEQENNNIQTNQLIKFTAKDKTESIDNNTVSDSLHIGDSKAKTDIIKIAARNIINMDISSDENINNDSNDVNFDLDFLNESSLNKKTNSNKEDQNTGKQKHINKQATSPQPPTTLQTSSEIKMTAATTTTTNNNHPEIIFNDSTTKTGIEDTIEVLTIENANESASENNKTTLDLFQDGLQLSSEQSYDNLFNGNSDEHYFQAFRDNNLSLFTNLQERSDAAEDLTKLLHSPLDFLNEKFLS